MYVALNVILCSVTVVSVGFSVSDYEVLEGNSVMVAVELWGETDVDIVVNLATRDLVATGPCYFSHLL